MRSLFGPVQCAGLPVEVTVAISPSPPLLRAARKSASVLEQPHLGNASVKKKIIINK